MEINNLSDIESRDHIQTIMRQFYDKLLADESISYIFTEVAQVNLEHHFPILVDFWDSVLFGTGVYNKNAMLVHIELAKKTKLSPSHFTTWLAYLEETINALHSGKYADEMYSRAKNIAALMQFKVSQ